MSRALTALALLAAGLLGLIALERALARHGEALRVQAAVDQGRRLYWQVRRTHHVHEPFELADQLAFRRDDPAAVLDALALEPGETAADVGCGSGFYTFEMATRLGESGTLWSLDVQAESLDFLRQRLAVGGCRGCAEIRILQNTLDDARLPAQSIDALLMANLDFYAFRPMLPESERMLASCFAATKPGGRLVVVQDMLPVPGGAVEHIAANFADAGFALDGQEPIADSSFLLRLHRP